MQPATIGAMKTTWLSRLRALVRRYRWARDRSLWSGYSNYSQGLKSARVRVTRASFGRRPIRPIRAWDRLTHA
jgi:hypothetical protein